MNNNLIVSVVIPVYNQEDLIIRALDSIPKRKDIEIIICNDASKDKTKNNIEKFKQNNEKYFNKIIYLENNENRGVGYTINKCYDAAKGEYVVALGSDDYFYTKEFNNLINFLYKTNADMVYFNLKDNNNNIFDLNEKSKEGLVGSVKFIKRNFLGDTRCPDKRCGEDWDFSKELYKKNPIEFFTHMVVKHYNFPRVGSLYDIQQRKRNIIDAISVIIPVKNRKENTKKLLNELIYQKNKYYPETEIIVIENNSLEDMSFLEEYKDDIILKHETIPGVSHARNIGLDLARGKYISFIDNDDFIANNYLHLLYQKMRKTNCDWCVFPDFVDGKLLFSYEDFDMENPLKTTWAVWHYCYKREIIKDIRFNENLNAGEDIEWIKKVITKDTKGEKILEPLYYYKWNNNIDSLSHLLNRGIISKERS